MTNRLIVLSHPRDPSSHLWVGPLTGSSFQPPSVLTSTGHCGAQLHITAPPCALVNQWRRLIRAPVPQSYRTNLSRRDHWLRWARSGYRTLPTRYRLHNANTSKSVESYMENVWWHTVLLRHSCICFSLFGTKVWYLEEQIPAPLDGYTFFRYLLVFLQKLSTWTNTALTSKHLPTLHCTRASMRGNPVIPHLASAHLALTCATSPPSLL